MTGQNLLKTALIASCLIFSSGRSACATNTEQFQRANEQYRGGRFQDALVLYQDLIERMPANGALYFNAGNCYYKIGRFGDAILNYERALRYMPRDPDLRANLAVARQKVPGQEDRYRRAPLERLLKAFSGKLTTNEIISWLMLLYLVFIGYLGFLLLGKIRNKRSWILVGAMGFAICLGVAVLGYRLGPQNRDAIAVQARTNVRFEPLEDAGIHYELTEGGKVRVLAEQGGWAKIERPDGKIGWTRRDAVKLIAKP